MSDAKARGREGAGARGRALIRLGTMLALLCASAPLHPSDLSAQSLAKHLDRRLDRRLDAPPFDRAFWGVAVVNQKGKLVYGRNEHRLFTPASNAKLVVSAVAAALLPPDLTVRTSLYAGGPIKDGVLQGDLVLYGRGDPTLGIRCYGVDTLREGACDRDPFARLRVLAEGLKAKGVRIVQGDLVGDGSYFEPLLVHPGWELFDLNWWYAAPVSGLGFHDNSIDFTWAPGTAPGAPALISYTPDLEEILFENRTVTVPAGGVTDIGNRFFRVPGTDRVWAEGTVAMDRAPHTESFAVTDPNRWAARALRQALAEAGIAVAGTTRSTTDSMLYRQARSTPPLAEVAGRPVRDWIFPILNTSQNWFAEMLLKQLGKRFGRAGSWEEGLHVEARFLTDSLRIDSTEFALKDGSGLSAENLVSPWALTQLLRTIRTHPHYPAFAEGLPVAGGVGSLRTRFVGTPLEGQVRAKTGSIGRVNSLSGYIERPDGKWLTFSIQVNHHTQPTKTVLAAIDSLVVEMAK
jgi:D-alanyl-D-alanine carboxypeptidase/D-alanyl-D-alanine-endopeptidase (penicillin-binding protein 4)